MRVTFTKSEITVSTPSEALQQYHPTLGSPVSISSGYRLRRSSGHICHSPYHSFLGGYSHMHYSHGGALAYPYHFPCEASIFQHCHFPLDYSSRATRPSVPEYLLQQHTYGFCNTHHKSIHSFFRNGIYNIHSLDTALLLGRFYGGGDLFYTYKVRNIMGGYLSELFCTFVFLLHFLSTQSAHRYMLSARRIGSFTISGYRKAQG